MISPRLPKPAGPTTMTIPPDLAEDLANHRAVLFLGSGISRGSSAQPGYPMADELATKIAQELLGRQPRPTENLTQIAQTAIWECGGSRQPLEALLVRTFAQPSVTPQAAHLSLPALRLVMVTTNYDQQTEAAFKERGTRLNVVNQDNELPLVEDCVLVKAHGCISRPSSCVISEEDYYDWMSSDSEIKNLLRSWFTMYRIVFIGYSLTDPNFRQLLMELRRKFGSSLRRSHIITPKIDHNCYTFKFATNVFNAHFIEETADEFLTKLADSYTTSPEPYTSRLRESYFLSSRSLDTSFLDYSAKSILNDILHARAGRMTLDHEVVSRIYNLAKPHSKSMYKIDPSAPKAPQGMVYVPPGEFIMGGARLGNETMRLERIENGFFIDKCQVSNCQYRDFLRSITRSKDHSLCHPDEPANKDHAPWNDFSGSSAQDVRVAGLPEDYFVNPAYDEYPVVNIDWWDAYAYSRWKDKRLPTEAEWEKAARGVDGRLFPYGNTLDTSCCNVAESGIRRPTPLRNYPRGRSPYGCYDMCGNVWEWCADPFHPESSPVESRVVRGGSCTRGVGKSTVNFRNGRRITDRWITRGFRCAADLSRHP